MKQEPSPFSFKMDPSSPTASITQAQQQRGSTGSSASATKKNSSWMCCSLFGCTRRRKRNPAIDYDPFKGMGNSPGKTLHASQDPLSAVTPSFLGDDDSQDTENHRPTTPDSTAMCMAVQGDDLDYVILPRPDSQIVIPKLNLSGVRC